jgi:dTDP-4-dehydrorhamnose reductase
VIELWGGHECTVNRVEDRFGDQSELSGHSARDDDLERFASLGISALRYPLLWEQLSPDRPEQREWNGAPQRLERIRAAGIRPIVGLLHHGSGPRYTSLVDEGFAVGLQAHARAVAERLPWVEEWTPVNEPLTTARFSGLYGLWYPHARDERTFWLAFLNQIDATRLAMRAIRTVNPAARLVQTEDLGRTYATAPLRDRAAYDNVRRWMTWDLLLGRVGPGHDFWKRLCGYGFEDRLRAIMNDPCPPDVLGVNHYLTSDRFLDHRRRNYPEKVWGRDSRQRLADVETIRALDPPSGGLRGAWTEAWERYNLPVAGTEVHVGCTRDEQLRWLVEAWTAGEELRASGADFRAVTVWALLGSQGWNTLLTARGVYEPGAFDVSGATPRPTAIARAMQALSSGSALHPVLDGQGWWRRPIRLAHPRAPRAAPVRDYSAAVGPTRDRREPVLITGATGTLGQALARACAHRDVAHVLTARGELALDDEVSIAAALDRHRPWVVINAAGWVRVDDAEDAEAACCAVNTTGATALTRACAERGIPTVSFSSDLVFDGRDAPYVEGDLPAPLNAYGRSKAAMEERIAALDGTHLIARTAAFFSPHDEHNFAVAVCRTLARGERFHAADDQIVSPTYVPHLCNAVLDLAIDGERGVWHLTSGMAMSWAEFAVRVAERCGLDPNLIVAVPGAELNQRAPRPANVALAATRGRVMPDFDDALRCFAEKRTVFAIA